MESMFLWESFGGMFQDPEEKLQPEAVGTQNWIRGKQQMDGKGAVLPIPPLDGYGGLRKFRGNGTAQ